MTGAAHLLAGSSIYLLTGRNKIMAPLLAIISHYALDAIPHYDSPAWNIPLGFLAVIFLYLTVIKNKEPFILVCALCGMLPDINSFFCFSSVLLDLHQRFHFDKTYEIPISYLYWEIYGCLITGYLLWTRYPVRTAPIRGNPCNRPLYNLYKQVLITCYRLAFSGTHSKQEVNHSDRIVNGPAVNKSRSNDVLQGLEKGGYGHSINCDLKGLAVIQSTILNTGKQEGDQTQNTNSTEFGKDKIN